jgi:hypothetical protein
MKRSTVALSLFVPLLCAAVVAGASAAGRFPVSRWTVYHVSNVMQDTWTTPYSVSPWPISVEFKCSRGAVIINARNTSTLHRNVRITAWDVERSEDVLDRAIASGRSDRNRGVTLPAGQSSILNLYRPPLCSTTPENFVFAAVYGS